MEPVEGRNMEEWEGKVKFLPLLKNHHDRNC